jgi:hypothetical protein
MRILSKLWTERDDEILFREMNKRTLAGVSAQAASRRLAPRLGRSTSAVQTRFQNLRIQRRNPPIYRTVQRETFLRDPKMWLEIARKEGTVAIVDRFGKVRAILSVPGPR